GDLRHLVRARDLHPLRPVVPEGGQIEQLGRVLEDRVAPRHRERLCQPLGYPVSRLGVWRSLVARSVRVGEAPSSNLGTPTSVGEPRVPPRAPSFFVTSARS